MNWFLVIRVQTKQREINSNKKQELLLRAEVHSSDSILQVLSKTVEPQSIVLLIKKLFRFED